MKDVHRRLPIVAAASIPLAAHAVDAPLVFLVVLFIPVFAIAFGALAGSSSARRGVKRLTVYGVLALVIVSVSLIPSSSIPVGYFEAFLTKVAIYGAIVGVPFVLAFELYRWRVARQLRKKAQGDAQAANTLRSS